jgi:hypothetical protein
VKWVSKGEKTMEAILEKELLLPNQYVDVTDQEMEYVDGGVAIATILGIVTAVIAASGATYGAGRVAGERAYYAGLRNSTYQKWKWQIRAAAVGVGGVAGGIFMLGFENKFYSMI